MLYIIDFIVLYVVIVQFRSFDSECISTSLCPMRSRSLSDPALHSVCVIFVNALVTEFIYINANTNRYQYTHTHLSIFV